MNEEMTRKESRIVLKVTRANRQERLRTIAGDVHCKCKHYNKTKTKKEGMILFTRPCVCA
jgi:hypothetical protein